MVASKPVHEKFNLSNLPPTSAAARQHSFRVYPQVQQWCGVELNPTEWGWRMEQGRLRPVPTLLEAAPQDILHLIVCNCKADCEDMYECRKSGLRCTNICGYCAGNG